MRLPGDFTFKKTGDPWLSWHYITSNHHAILTATQQHVILTVYSVLLGMAITLPLVALARRSHFVRTIVLGLCNAIYAVPSLAFVVALFKIFTLSRLTVVIPLASYSLVIFVRSVLTGLDEVSPEAVDAARGMGFSERRIFFKVRLPMAVPTLVTGLRLVTVSTIELVVIGGFIGQGGYGAKVFEGYRNSFHTEITTYIVLTILLALIADGLLLALSRALTPWRRGGGGVMITPSIVLAATNNSTWHQITTWFSTKSSWTGNNVKTGAIHLLVQHLWISAVSLAIASVIAIPLASLLARWRRGGAIVSSVANAARAIPIVGVMLLLAVGPIGIGTSPAIIALVIFAIPPVLTNTFTGIREVDSEVTQAAIGMGMSRLQVNLRVELPLAIPLIANGVRLAFVQVWATATIAAIIGSGGLGELITHGYAVQDYGEVYGGVVIVIVTALLLDGLLGIGQVRVRRRFGAVAAPLTT